MYCAVFVYGHQCSFTVISVRLRSSVFVYGHQRVIYLSLLRAVVWHIRFATVPSIVGSLLAAVPRVNPAAFSSSMVRLRVVFGLPLCLPFLCKGGSRGLVVKGVGL